ncbi:MAG: Mammalian cell entry related domain protein, partial [Solirubrobacterales bacterium]|nr:Mammalian cell entry related domain protein [Solirubrobacterales bacterium]
ARETDLAGFVRGTASAAAALEPVAGRLGGLIDDSATTLAALDDDSLDQVLANLPPAESAATGAFAAVGPVLDDAAAITRSLAPAGAVLESSLRRVDSVVRTATPVTRRVGALAGPMDTALRAVDAFSRNPSATGAIKALGGQDLATFGGSAFIGLGAILRTTSTAQLHCNATALWMRNLASTASEGDSGGNWLRMIPVFSTTQISHAATPAPDLHVNYYPHENAKECESGNETYAPGQAIGNPAGRQPASTEDTTQAETG